MTDHAVNDYKEAIKKKAEDLILNDFPAKIVKLNELLDKLNFHNRNLSDVHQEINIPMMLEPEDGEPRCKKRRSQSSRSRNSISSQWQSTVPSEPVLCNKPLGDLIRFVKPHIRQLVEDSNSLKLWISYMIPKIEDGNNFGVWIQGTALQEIKFAEAQAEEFLDQILDYSLMRAKIVSKVAKYPFIEDYRRAVRELDEKEYLSLWLQMCAMRDHYCMLHDLVTKNFDKIKTPRTSHTLY